MLTEVDVIERDFRKRDEEKSANTLEWFPGPSNREELGTLELAPARSQERQRRSAC
jgi:hypothetical protein